MTQLNQQQLLDLYLKAGIVEKYDDKTHVLSTNTVKNNLTLLVKLTGKSPEKYIDISYKTVHLVIDGKHQIELSQLDIIKSSLNQLINDMTIKNNMSELIKNIDELKQWVQEFKQLKKEDASIKNGDFSSSKEIDICDKNIPLCWPQPLVLIQLYSKVADFKITEHISN
jgi:hypothetical protein